MIVSSFRRSMFLLMALVCMISCDKDGLHLPTGKRKNTFQCKIGREIFKPYFKAGLFNNNEVLAVSNSRNYNRFSLYAHNQKTSQSVAIEFPYVSGTGTYKLQQYRYRGTYDAGFRNPGWYTTDSVHTGELVIIKCDMARNIYAGTFYFTGIDPNTKRIVNVTNGRFDVKE